MIHRSESVTCEYWSLDSDIRSFRLKKDQYRRFHSYSLEMRPSVDGHGAD